MIPRQDIRKERLRDHVRENLKASLTYADFEQKMKSLGYQVQKGRGISFIDDKKVKIKGSEVGFSLIKIETILDLQRQLKIKKLLKNQTPSFYLNFAINARKSHLLPPKDYWQNTPARATPSSLQ